MRIKFIPSYIYLTVMASAMTLLFSCESNFKDIQRFNKVAFTPAGTAENINLKYTDSGRIKAILKSKLMYDFSNAKYPFTEFPVGVALTVYDSDNKENYVYSKYAVSHSKSGIIELKDSVRITTFDGKVLETEQLFYDQKQDWFFTEKYFKFRDRDGGYIEGPGVDFSKDFKIFNAQRNRGELNKIE